MQYGQSNFIFVCKSFGFLIISLSVISFSVSPAQVVLAINSIHNPLLDFLFVILTNLGNGVVLVPFVFLLCFRTIYLSIGLLVSAVIQGVIVLLCKRVLFVSAMRPSALIDPSMVYFVPGLDVHKSMSFPSGHTVTIFGLCIYLALCYRNNFVTVLLVTIAGLVGISRIYLMQHFITDVVGGSIIGSVTAVLVYQWMEQMNKPRWMNQHLEVTLKSTNSKPRFS